MDLQALEKSARRAKSANSFSDYKDGSATAEFMAYCENAEKVASSAKERLAETKAPADRAERVDALLNKYKTQKLAWLISLNENRASVPSIMIAGGSNFPTRRKEKQNARERALFKSDPEYIVKQIKTVGRNAGVIRSDDENAVHRIKAKIESLKGQPDPFGNNAAEIRRMRQRLFELAPKEFVDLQNQTSVNGAKTYDEILALWDGGRIVPGFDGDRYYYELPLLFYNGKRRYREFLNFETDEKGENRIAYSLKEGKTVSTPLTDECKYNLIISEIRGSGNKNIMYQHLKGLSPAEQERIAKAKEQAENGEARVVTINGESAEVVADEVDKRLRLLFDGKPEVETRNILKSNGFRWSPRNMAWQRLLNANSEIALNRIAE